MSRLIQLLLLLSPSWALAQGISTISGKLLDAETGRAVEYASVSVTLHESGKVISGAYTNEKGVFEVQLPDTLVVDLMISMIGYDKLVLEELNTSKSQKLGELKFTTNVQDLGEVEISEQKEFVEFKIDKKVYDVSNLQLNETATVSEALQVIPSIQVDIDGNISLRGSENLVVLIDGKPVALSGDDLAAYLESLPSSVIQNVEVITNPSAKYDPDGMAGIINFNTKTNKLEGFSGNVSVNTGLGGFYTGSAMIAVKKGKWNTLANVSFNYRDAFNTGDTYRETFWDNDSTSYLSQTTEGDHLMQMAMARVNTSYQLNDYNSFSASAMLSMRNMNRNELNYYEFSDVNEELNSVYDRTTDGGGKMMPMNFNLSYDHDFGETGRKLSLSTAYSDFTGEFGSDFEETLYSDDFIRDDEASLRQRQITGPDNYTFTAQADYEHPLGENQKFEAGLKSISKSGGSDFMSEVYDYESDTWINELGLSNDFVLDEGINSAYGVYQQQIGKFGFQAGLRAEQAFTDARLLSTGESFRNEYFSFFPTLHTSFWLPKRQQLKASYSRRLNRPHGRMLNPFTDYSDPQNIRKGNPFLLPEYINSYELEYIKYWDKVTFNTSLYLKEINEMITRVKEVEDGISTVSYQNVGTGTNMGFEYSFTINPSKKWNIVWSGNAFRTVIENDDSELNASGYAYNSKLLTSVTLPFNTTFQLQANYKSPKILAQGTISEMYWGDVSMAKKVLNNKGKITLKLSDVTNTRQYAFTIDDVNFYQESYRKRQSRIFWLGFSYSFGQYRDRGSRSGGKDDSGFGGAEID